jgi:hypothetical protein
MIKYRWNCLNLFEKISTIIGSIFLSALFLCLSPIFLFMGIIDSLDARKYWVKFSKEDNSFDKLNKIALWLYTWPLYLLYRLCVSPLIFLIFNIGDNKTDKNCQKLIE